MGQGIEAARAAGAGLRHVLDNMKDQLLVVLMKRLANKNGEVDIPAAELDDTGSDLLVFSIDMAARTFHFQLSKKS